MIDDNAIINALPFAIFLKGIKGEYLYCNKKFIIESGYDTKEEILGKTDYDMPWHEYAKDYANQDNMLLNKEMEYFHQEEQYLFNGKSIRRNTYKSLIYSDYRSEYNILGVYNSHGNSKLLDSILNNIPHHIFWKDLHGRFLGCNKAFAEAAGMRNPKEIIGKTDHDMPWREQARKYIADDKEVIDSEAPMLGFEDVQTRTNGSKITALVSKIPLRHVDKTNYGILGVYADITEIKSKELEMEKLIQEARQADLAKSAFISDMSHDIRTPISGIIGLAKKLSEDLSEDTAKSLIASDIHCAGEKLMQLCNQILEAAEISHGVNQKIGVSFNLEHLITDVVDIMRASIKYKQLELNLELDLAHKNFFGYKTLIHRVLLNLISNAVKFTEKGSITIIANTESLTSDMTNLEIKVCDTGPGIPEAQQRLIFNHFQRGTSSYGSHHNGTGLGLYIVKEFVTQMSGNISLESEKNQGSCFKISIPLIKTSAENYTSHSADTSEKDLNQQQNEKENNIKNNKDLQILLVEDDPISQRVGKFSFEKLSLKINIATNGKQALNLAKNIYYDYIFLDIGLPDINGIVVAEKIKKLPSYIGRDNKIIALTAHFPRNKISALTENGFAGFIRKPLTAQLITSVLNGDKSIGCEHQSIFNEEIEMNHASNHTASSRLRSTYHSGTSSNVNKETNTANEILGMLLSSLPDTMLEMEHAWRQKNRLLLEKLTHRLHSAACYAPLPKLREALQKLEISLQNNNIATIDLHFNDLKIKIRGLMDSEKMPT